MQIVLSRQFFQLNAPGATKYAEENTVVTMMTVQMDLDVMVQDYVKRLASFNLKTKFRTKLKKNWFVINSVL